MGVHPKVGKIVLANVALVPLVLLLFPLKLFPFMISFYYMVPLGLLAMGTQLWTLSKIMDKSDDLPQFDRDVRRTTGLLSLALWPFMYYFFASSMKTVII